MNAAPIRCTTRLALVCPTLLLIAACREPAPPPGEPAGEAAAEPQRVATPGAPDIRTPPVPAFAAMEPSVRAQFEPVWEAALEPTATAESVGALGRLYHAYEQPEHAYDCYEIAAARARGTARTTWTYLLGVVADDLGRSGAAEAAFESVIEASGADGGARLRRAHARRRHGDDDGALADYRAALELGAGAARAHHGAGAILLARGEWSEAERHLTEAVRIAPGYGAAWYALATLLRETDRADEARGAFSRAAEFSGDEPPWGDPRLEAVQSLATGPISRLHDAVDLLQRDVTPEELNQALEMLRDVVTRAPEIAEGHAQLGAALLLAGDGLGARIALARAVALEPGFVEAHYNLGLLAYRDQRLDDAAAAFAAMLALSPESFDGQLGLGMTLARLDRLDQGAAALERAIDLGPEDARPPLHLATLLRRHGHDAGAETALRAAVERMPAHLGLRQRLADLLATSTDESVRKPAEAVRLSHVLLSESRHPRVYETLATALMASGNRGAAVETLQSGADEARRTGRLGDAERLASALRSLSPDG